MTTIGSGLLVRLPAGLLRACVKVIRETPARVNLDQPQAFNRVLLDLLGSLS